MKYAVTILPDRTVASHGGRARHFLLFDAEPGMEPRESGAIELTKDDVLHNFGDGRPHPIDGVAVLITGSSGDGFIAHMKRRGIELVLTSETDPRQAVLDHLAGTVKPAQAMHHPHTNPHDPESGDDCHGHH